LQFNRPALEAAVYTRSADGFVASELSRGPWDPGAQHGGAPAALLAHVLESLPAADGLQTARITYELLRPVPLGTLSAQASVIRPGRRVQLLEASLYDVAGVELVRARALQVQGASVVATPVQAPEPPLPPEPESEVAVIAGPPPGSRGDTLFPRDAVEIRVVAGDFATPGPGTAWFRLRMPVVEGAEVSPLQRVAAAADFGNGVSAAVSWERHMFINPDLTLYVERAPAGEWIGLDAITRIVDGGVGLAESVLYDERGRIGRAVQALLVAPR
jgi:hypothetical protein